MVRYYALGAATGGVDIMGTGAQDLGEENIADAYAYYTILGLLDPKNPIIDAQIAASTFGVSWWKGLGIAALVGAPIAGAVLTIIDPAHRYKGGLDDTALGQKIGSRRKMSSFTVWSMERNPLGMLMYQPDMYNRDPYYQT